MLYQALLSAMRAVPGAEDTGQGAFVENGVSLPEGQTGIAHGGTE